MSDAVIRAESLGKRYRLGEREPYRNLGDVLTNAAGGLLRRTTASSRPREEHLWALSDISFEVRGGEVLGIIGPNGAGKSTLLKILARITRPSVGWVRIRGRAGSLLEVGTGFHPELTGRDNVYLVGVILGMNRREIARKFDEIVEFAGVERFLDTPVKRYSSGMFVRLGFAVAAHLEPEILIVDEVLAVGDAEFQRKCLGKMGDVADEGRTILFVSHNMNAVQRLCTRGLALKQGEVAIEGPTADVVEWYLGESVPTEAGDGWHATEHLLRQAGTGDVRVVRIACESDPTTRALQARPDGPLEVSLVLESDADRRIGSVAVAFRDQFGTLLVNADSIDHGRSVRVGRGRTLVRARIDALHLRPGTYVVGWSISDPLGAVYDVVERAFHINVIDAAAPGFGIRPTVDGAVTCDFDVSAEPMD